MKKIYALILSVFLTACTTQPTLNWQMTDNAIDNNTQVIYVPAANYWNNGGMAEGRIIFTKHITSGSGSYSEYTSAKDTLYLPTTYEFLYDGRLIGYNQHDLKFYEVIYKKGKFDTVVLSLKQVQDLFPDLQIITTSSAKNGVITVQKPVFESKTFLLLNDTKESYYHYSFEDFKNTNTSPFKSLITVKDGGKIIFSHFGDRSKEYPILTIKVEDTI